MTITSQVQHQIQAALNAVAAKFGLIAPRADVRRFRGVTGVRIMKLDMMGTAVAATVPTIKSNDASLARAMERFGITSTTNAKGDTLVGFNPRALKFCFQYRSIRGTDWNCTADQAKKRFG